MMGLREYMDIVESFNEADQRSLIDKLTDMIAHDGTPETERRAAVKKLAAAIKASGVPVTDADVEQLSTAVSPSEHDRRNAINRFVNAQRASNSNLGNAIKAYSRFA